MGRARVDASGRVAGFYDSERRNEDLNMMMSEKRSRFEKGSCGIWGWGSRSDQTASSCNVSTGVSDGPFGMRIRFVGKGVMDCVSGSQRTP